VELTTLRQFIAIARARHMTRAARQLGITQPALSAMVRKLEMEVGTELLERTGRGIDLTEAGRVFLVHAEDAVRRADAAVTAVREVMGLERGSIRIGGGATATSYLLPRVVSAVRKAHPGLRFYVREAGSSAVAAAVSSGELDLGIVTLPLKGPETDELLRVPLVEDELRLIGLKRGVKAGARASTKSEGGRVATAGLFTWAEIAAEPIVAFEAGTAVRELLDRAAAAAGVSLNVVMELRSIESIKQMVAAGIGVGFVSRFALKDGEGLACRDGKLSRSLAIVRPRGRMPSPAVAEFERELLSRGRSRQR
jgi:DNA-binding transcriptional LysR family regulator